MRIYPARNFREISTRIGPKFPGMFFGKPPNSAEICGGNVRKPKSRVAGSNPKFGKIWPDYATGILSKVVKKPRNFGKISGSSGLRKEAGACAAEKGPGQA